MEETLESDYSYYKHLHNYAVWTAARAAQRGFTTTKNIKFAIESTELRNLLEGDKVILDSEAFDEFHTKSCEQIIAKLNNLSEIDKSKLTFGRAAKIVNIYIKTVIVIPNPGSPLSHIAHPPIDRILLMGLQDGLKMKFDNISWTGFNQEAYSKIIAQCKELGYGTTLPFWSIEKYWNLVRETDVDT